MQTSTTSRPFVGIGRHLSHSQVNLFDRCQLAWWFRYVKGIEKLPTVPMALGSAYHKALALNFTQKRITGVDLPVNEVVRHFEDVFNTDVRENRVDVAPEADLSIYRDPVARLLRHYYEEYVVGQMEPILVEHQMVCQIPGCDRIFAGILDVQLNDGTIIDFKVTSRRWKEEDAASNTQATAYALLYGYETNFEFHVGLRANKKPAIQVVKARRTRDDVEDYVRHIQNTVSSMEQIEAGEVGPMIYTGYCNDRICQYWRECQEWKYGF